MLAIAFEANIVPINLLWNILDIAVPQRRGLREARRACSGIQVIPTPARFVPFLTVQRRG